MPGPSGPARRSGRSAWNSAAATEPEVIPGYTVVMKTAISVPDETYNRAERAARRHGMNRSQFYAAAAERYVAELESADLTDAVDAVAEAANSDASARFAAAAGGQLLDGTDDEW
jgi:predicted DNA-binding protein